MASEVDQAVCKCDGERSLLNPLNWNELQQPEARNAKFRLASFWSSAHTFRQRTGVGWTSFQLNILHPMVWAVATCWFEHVQVGRPDLGIFHMHQVGQTLAERERARLQLELPDDERWRSSISAKKYSSGALTPSAFTPRYAMGETEIARRARLRQDDGAARVYQRCNQTQERGRNGGARTELLILEFDYWSDSTSQYQLVRRPRDYHQHTPDPLDTFRLAVVGRNQISHHQVSPKHDSESVSFSCPLTQVSASQAVRTTPKRTFMSFGMAERHQVRAHDSKLDGSAQEKKAEHKSIDKEAAADDDYDDLRLSTSSIIELDRKDLLIVKDGTVRVAESLDREQQQLDANGEVVKASGTWTKAEHERFLRAMETFPKGPWKAIAEMVATRTVRQTQTHAQKYREKLARRMRGLRNRNGTLQTAPMAVGVGSYPHHVSPYANVPSRVYHPGAMGYVSSVPMTSMAAIPLARATSLPAMSMHSSPLHHATSYASPPMSDSMAMVSSEFSQLSTSTISSAFIGNASYPASWEANATEIKPTVPDFDESMDFLMDVYSTNPSQINTVVPQQSSGLTVTPTACIPRTPQTPMSSLVMKRHPGYGFTQQPQMNHVKHFTHMDNGVNREQGAKGV
ncbi:hypothetical protein PHYPSEUDO_015215 [Phytophthora pseudosyringae]|uniref:Myb-like DNA-binding protein n=1 Tax=Phytophthora pseudosyringae TaxID=221518 RepID=A0A8T1W2N5_9STRA|nr:hypothetical protein PHYPSEUDO_015215 [Phytophthora pseudosyringae]